MLMARKYKALLAIAAMMLLLAGCKAGVPEVTKLRINGADLSRKMSLGSSSGVTLSGATTQIKFNIGYAAGDSNPTQTQVVSGTTIIRNSSAGVLNGK